MTGISQRAGHGPPEPGDRSSNEGGASVEGAGTGMRICPKCRTTYSSGALSLCYRDGERLVDYERFMAVERDPMRGVLIGGKYRLVERVGQGGMGTIYRAVQAGLNRAVAVKILKRELNLDPDTVARFHREANAMSLLTHPNTVRVYDFGQTDDGLLYLVMELLVGELITDVMARGPLPVADAVHMTQQLLRSLAEAHRKAIVHRDLKPDNVFVATVEGHGEPVIKVLDFGIAKVVAPDRRVDQFETQAGTVFGTPRYMSPEQAQGAALDGRSDLYSVGALLYQMLVGRPPFTDEDAVVVMAKHIQQMPVAPSDAVPERPIPKRLNDVVMRALAKDPRERFQEAAEFDRALEGCLPEVDAANEAHLTGRWARPPTRHWVTLSYALLALVLSSAGYFGVRVYAKMNAPSSRALSDPGPLASPSEPLETLPETSPLAQPAPVAAGLGMGGTDGATPAVAQGVLERPAATAAPAASADSAASANVRSRVVPRATAARGRKSAAKPARVKSVRARPASGTETRSPAAETRPSGPYERFE